MSPKVNRSPMLLVKWWHLQLKLYHIHQYLCSHLWFSSLLLEVLPKISKFLSPWRQLLFGFYYVIYTYTNWHTHSCLIKEAYCRVSITICCIRGESVDSALKTKQTYGSNCLESASGSDYYWVKFHGKKQRTIALEHTSITEGLKTQWSNMWHEDQSMLPLK